MDSSQTTRAALPYKDRKTFMTLGQGFKPIACCDMPEDEQCTICMMPFREESQTTNTVPVGKEAASPSSEPTAVELPCGHHFCSLCITTWFETRIGKNKAPPTNCPLCRKDFFPKEAPIPHEHPYHVDIVDDYLIAELQREVQMTEYMLADLPSVIRNRSSNRSSPYVVTHTTARNASTNENGQRRIAHVRQLNDNNFARTRLTFEQANGIRQLDNNNFGRTRITFEHAHDIRLMREQRRIARDRTLTVQSTVFSHEANNLTPNHHPSHIHSALWGFREPAGSYYNEHQLPRRSEFYLPTRALPECVGRVRDYGLIMTYVDREYLSRLPPNDLVNFISLASRDKDYLRDRMREADTLVPLSGSLPLSTAAAQAVQSGFTQVTQRIAWANEFLGQLASGQEELVV